MSSLHAAAIVSGRAAAPTVALRFSQISHMLKCPVVGLCLTLEEQRKLVRKSGVCVAKAQDFDIHEILVNTDNEDTLLARQVNVLLRKKYELKAATLRRLDLLCFINHWDAAFASGKYAAELWAAATRPDLPLALQRHIFGCVHMDMHEALGDKHKYLEQLHTLRQERATLTEKMRAAKAELAQKHKDMQALQRQHETVLRQRDALHAENERLKNRGAAHDPDQQAREATLRATVAGLEHSLQQAQTRARKAEQDHAKAVEAQDMQRDLVQELQAEVQALLALTLNGPNVSPSPSGLPDQHYANCDASCANCTQACSACPQPCASCTETCHGCLCPRRVLLVGGMTRLEALYRNVVEAKGHEFEYHDGYLGGVNTLEASLQKADIVLCPVSCNSHRACLLVKNLCKKYKKPVHMMPSYSLSAVAKILPQ